jgi:glycosyltransferase involved in cell wall biosynthesis
MLINQVALPDFKMSNMPGTNPIAVTIITPTYNQARYLAETIDSILNQTYSSIEYIVINDGSTDATEEVVAPYIPRIKYISQENMGESQSVNKGYAVASGDIVGVVNADDPLYAAHAVEHIVDCFKNNSDALAVYPDWVSINAEGNVLGKVNVPEYSIERMLDEFKVTIGPGVFIRNSALENIGLRNESLKYIGDLDISFRLALHGNIIHVPEYLATHRVHDEAASTVCKGNVMASELFRLSTTSLASPLLSKELLVKKYRILSGVCKSAKYYCGESYICKLRYELKYYIYSAMDDIGVAKYIYSDSNKKPNKINVLRSFVRYLLYVAAMLYGLLRFIFHRLLYVSGTFLRNVIPSKISNNLRLAISKRIPLSIKEKLAKTLRISRLID